MRLPAHDLPWPIPMSAVALIAEAESCRLRAYRCPAGVWTIGWGRTDGVAPGMTCTQEQADRWLCEDLSVRSAAIQRMLTTHAEPNQLGAMVSLAYNIGLASFARSTVLKAHNRGDEQAAARAFALWNRAGGQVLRGLTARRAAEAALYLQPEPDAPAERMPQAVEAESSLAASPIAQAGGVTVAGAGVTALGQAGDALQGAGDQLGIVATSAKALRGSVDSIAAALGMSTPTLVCVALLAAGAAVVWQRVKQRRGGWA